VKSSPLGTRVVPIDAGPGRLRLLDQRRLPREESWIDCSSAADAADAIRSLAVRGAPLIGVAAAWGLALEASRLAARGAERFDADWEDAAAASPGRARRR
jgi:methylthioribose-1-phosphate isomerase